jgi:hypothetical protein
MTPKPDPPPVVSLSGSPIWRHDEPSPWQPVQGEECIEQISSHIEAHLGPVASVFHEVMSDTVHIDVHFVKPVESFPFIRLVTSGMSDLPMGVPDGSGAPKYLELQITLPGTWRLDEASMKDEQWYWPVRLLKTLARLPHKYQTWLGYGHSMPNGDPPQPYAPNTALCGAVILPSLTVPEGFRTLRISDDKVIHFMAAVPVYRGEMDFKLRSGCDALTERFDRYEIADIVDLHRRDVAAKRFWVF